MAYGRIRKAATGIALVTAVGALAACGPDGGGTAAHHDSGTPGGGTGGSVPVALSALRTAADRTGQADSAVVDSTTDIAGTTMAMHGKLAWPDGITGDMTVRMHGGQLASGLTQLGGDGTFQARYLTDAAYVDLGSVIAQADGGRPWLKYDYDMLGKLAGGSGNSFKDFFQNDNPTRSVQMLIGSGDVKEAGSATVRGVRATHYTGTVDVAKLAGTQADAATVKALKAQLKTLGMTTDHLDVWVDGHGLLVKKTDRASTAQGSLTSTAYYSDYGVKVSVTPPPAAQTMDLTELLQQQGRDA
jgi:hypothetical protein